MTNFSAALFAETLKMRRSKVPLFTALGFCLMPLVDGIFMLILKNPEAASSLGLITMKARLLTGTADWPSFFSFMSQAIAAGGMVLFSIFTIWIFGREFSDHTVKDWLALPTRRETIVAAKFVAMTAWSLVVTLLVFSFSLLIGRLVSIPGFSMELLQTTFVSALGGAALTVPLMSFVAFIASSGRGYLPAFGWTILTLMLANIAAVMGRGDWFPWATPGLFTGIAGPRSELLGLHSYVVLIVAGLIGFVATFWWWRNADQIR
jgi:ABC-2 type transport system permease protein